MHLFEASKQWAKRPADERFWTLEEMLQASRQYAESACTASVNLDKLVIGVENDDLVVRGEHDQARFTNWSFKQLANRVKAPAGYLAGLPTTTAAACLNAGLRKIGNDGGDSNVLFHRNGSLVCRAFLSDAYSRIWNYEVLERLGNLQDNGWQVPPALPNTATGGENTRPATEEDCLRLRANGWGINPGDLIAPAGLYCSDHDMFVFMVNESVRIDDGSEHGLGRGVFITNSEVGAAALKVTRFLYRFVCGNHIVWDAKDVQELRIIHRGRADRRFGYQMQAELRQYANESTSADDQRIAECKRVVLGQTKDEVLDKLFGKKSLGLPRKTLEAAYDQATLEADNNRNVDPRSVWGMMQGITATARKAEHADERNRLDRAAGKLPTIKF